MEQLTWDIWPPSKSWTISTWLQLLCFPHCIVLLLGSFAAWSGGRLCLRRPERRCHDLLHEGEFSSFINCFILMIYNTKVVLVPFHIFHDYEDGFNLSLRWRQHIFMVLMISKESHGDNISYIIYMMIYWRQRIFMVLIKGVSWRLACSRFQLWPLRGVEHKVQGAVMFLF